MEDAPETLEGRPSHVKNKDHYSTFGSHPVVAEQLSMERTEAGMMRVWDLHLSVQAGLEHQVVGNPSNPDYYRLSDARRNSVNLETIRTPRERVLHELEPVMMMAGYDMASIDALRNNGALGKNALPHIMDMVVNTASGKPANDYWHRAWALANVPCFCGCGVGMVARR